MSVNLPTATNNPASLREAATTFKHGKLNMTGLHTHANRYYDERNAAQGHGKPFTDFCGCGAAAFECCCNCSRRVHMPSQLLAP